jgi:hypothetical protein
MTPRRPRTNGPIQYKVAYVKNLQLGDVKLDGHLWHNQTRISLDAEMNEQATAQVLLHEVVHALAAQMGRQNLKEDVVDALAYGVYQVMRDNPELVRMITK